MSDPMIPDQTLRILRRLLCSVARMDILSSMPSLDAECRYNMQHAAQSGSFLFHQQSHSLIRSNQV